MFKIGQTVEIRKDSDWNGVQGEVVNYGGTRGGPVEYLVRTPAIDGLPAGDFWFLESSLKAV